MASSNLSLVAPLPTNLKIELEAKSTEELKKELAAYLALTAEGLMRLALTVTILEERGEKFDGLKMGLVNILRKIATRSLLPEIVVMFAGSPSKLNKAAKLSIDEQIAILNGEEAIPDRKSRPFPKINIKRVTESFDSEEIGEMAAELIVNSKDQHIASQRMVSKLTGVVAMFGTPKEIAEVQLRNPITSEISYSDEETAFLKRMDEYQRNTGRKFPTFREILTVVKSLGYRKVATPESLPKFKKNEKILEDC